jgi:3-phenylpropionate/trans-cinnamate dioxygenase ferredoxin reductase subunit
LPKRSFTAFYLREGRVRAGFAIGRPKDIMATRRLIQTGKQVDPRVLADEQTDLKALAR